MWHVMTSPSRCGCWRTASSSTIRSAVVCVGSSAGAVSTNDSRFDWQALALACQIDAGRRGGRRSCSAQAVWLAIAHTDSSTSTPAGWPAPSRPKRFGALLDCHARFLTPPTERRHAAPSRSPFPTARWYELTRRRRRTDATHGGAVGPDVRLITAAPDGLGLVDLAPMHVLATSTLRRLADEHPDGSWDPRRMRPNILIDDRRRAGRRGRLAGLRRAPR